MRNLDLDYVSRLVGGDGVDQVWASGVSVESIERTTSPTMSPEPRRAAGCDLGDDRPVVPSLIWMPT